MTEEAGLAAFLVVGLGFSVFYGLKAVQIFQVTPVDKRSWRFHQFWLNFLGSVAGWIALWFFMGRVISAVESSAPGDFSWSSIILFVLAFVGVTGFLPMTVVNLINSIGALVGKIAGLPQAGEPRA